ncbi:Major carboxysome shell protein 1A [uncultured Clostridium sp.]|mgnify:CR=1 FL=1|uniref:BMC domain-containing protein n=1 Tax=uncultured Clostridium sp. TaxID=59620 RepID=UPI000822D374|nr:BMC domain-containing protein [uncultured Clostridium sp.]SCI73980.1 Major carboxysome shell protein 1A [uncultured Clostridium sp.]
MKALGLIETRGLLAAIEGADTMVKSADVSILEKTYVGGGLVSIAITGDVGAVKAAVESGVAAIKKLDSSLLVSEHVIPRPHDELDLIIGTKDSTENYEDLVLDEVKEVEDVVSLENDYVEMVNETDVNESDVNETDINEDIDENKDEIITEIEVKEDILEIIVEEVVSGDLQKVTKVNLDNLVKIDGIEKAVQELNKVKVGKLRNLVRQYENFGIEEEILSKSTKKQLISKIIAYYKSL